MVHPNGSCKTGDGDGRDQWRELALFGVDMQDSVTETVHGWRGILLECFSMNLPMAHHAVECNNNQCGTFTV